MLEGNFTTQELKQPEEGTVPASQNPYNWYVRFKKPLMVAGGIVAAFLIYKQIKK